MSSVTGVKILGGIILLLTVGGVITVSILHLYKPSSGNAPFQYGIMLDAGSTKTQVTLYKWEGQKEKGTGIVSQVETCKIKGGLHNERDIFHAGERILPCLENVSVSLPQEQRSKTPVYLGATAGMRMLRLEDKYLADGIILGTKYTLVTKTNFSVKDVNIISGTDEGTFAWVTGNFLLDTLLSDSNDHTATYGALDMGGASTQISFEITGRDVEDIDNKTTAKLKLYGQDHFVFSESYLCFGINEAMRRHRAILADGKNAEIEDPCGLKDNTVKYSSSYLYDHQCTKSLKKDGNEVKEYSFRGTGDISSCEAAVKKLVSNEECKKSFGNPCFSAPKEKIANVKYLAVSTFYFTASALNVTNATLQEYKSAIDDYCKLSIEEALNRLDPDMHEYASDYCLEAHYVHHILTKEYGFNETTWENIMFVMKVEGSDLGWSLGYMINATNAIPKGKPNSSEPYLSQATFILLLVILSILTVVAILLLLLLPRVWRSRQTMITVLP